MRTFSITFHGTVDDNEGQPETIEETVSLVRESFRPDAVAGLDVLGVSIHVDTVVTTRTQGSGS